MPGVWKPFHRKIHHCVFMTRDDALAFSGVLRQAFPRIRFLREDHAEKFFDRVGWIRACEEARRAARATPPRLDFTRNPREEWPDYFPSLADVLEKNFRVWLEPMNWRPRWYIRKRDDLLVLENAPRLHFTFTRGGFRLPDQRRRIGSDGDPIEPLRDLALDPAPLDRNEPVLLEGHRMMGQWRKGEDDEKRFVQQVWRLLDTVATNRLVAIDNHELTPIPPDGAARAVPYVRAARGARSWARFRRQNYLSWGERLYKPEAYFDWYGEDGADDDADSSEG